MGRPRGRGDLAGRAQVPSRRRSEEWRRELGRALRDARLERRVSADELGAAVKVDRTTIFRYERGARIAADKLRDITAALGLRLLELLESMDA